MREGKVVVETIRYLRMMEWEILVYDLPEMGMGFLLHPENSSSKNEGTVSPDIIAYREETILICEGKDHFSKKDIEKLIPIKEGKFDQSISNNFPSKTWEELLVSIAFPKEEYDDTENLTGLDCVFVVDKNCESIWLNERIKDLI